MSLLSLSSPLSSGFRLCWGSAYALHSYSNVSKRSRPCSILEDDDAIIDLSEDNERVNGARPNTAPPHLRQPPNRPTPYEWKSHRVTLRTDFPDGWAPPRKLSRDAMTGLRQLFQLDPQKFNTPILAQKFRISPEAVRRILKSKWEPPADKRAKLLERERSLKMDRVKLSRLKELMEARQVAQLNTSMGKKRRGSGSGSSDEDATQLHAEDKFTFE